VRIDDGHAGRELLRRPVNAPPRRAGGRRQVRHPGAADPASPDRLPDFVVNRGGEQCFIPGLRALRWLADLDT
jgi:hypothetical protein